MGVCVCVQAMRHEACMCAYMCTHIHTHIHTYITRLWPFRTSRYIHTRIHKHIHTYITRLWPSVPVNGWKRNHLERDIIVEGHVIPKNAELLIPIIAMQRNENIPGGEPDEFKPERWLKNAEDEKTLRMYVPRLLACIHVCMCLCVYVCVCIYIYIYTYIKPERWLKNAENEKMMRMYVPRLHACIRVCMCICVCTCVYMNVG